MGAQSRACKSLACNPVPAEPVRPSGLSERECDVLALVARGMSNAEIAEELTVSAHTVKSHVQHLLGKLGLRNRIHAVIYAFESGLVTGVNRESRRSSGLPWR